jgi:hypothetical protein
VVELPPPPPLPQPLKENNVIKTAMHAAIRDTLFIEFLDLSAAAAAKQRKCESLRNF